MVYYSKGEFEEALKCYNEALEIQKITYGSKHAAVAVSLNK